MMDIQTILPKIKKNILLRDYTTFKVGGSADYFIEIDNQDELQKTITVIKKLKKPFFVLGNGSNLLVSDSGYRGIVIKMSGDNISFENRLIYADSGVLLPSLSLFALEKGLAGMEWAGGVPGTVGGAVRGNAGAFGDCISDIVTRVRALNSNTGDIEEIENRGCYFGYRKSIFKKNPNLIIIGAELTLEMGDRAEIKKKTEKYLDYRKERHPVEPSAGSIFKNYVIKSDKERESLFSKFPELEKVTCDNVISTGFLIEKSGLKGLVCGGVMVSKLHSNFIINGGDGTALDIKKIITTIKERVGDIFGLSIEEEIQYVGFYKDQN